MPKFVGTKLNQVINMCRLEKTIMAKEVGVSRTAFYKYLNGESWPNAEHLRKILNILEPYGYGIRDILPDGEHKGSKL